MVDVSVIVVNWNTRRILCECLDSVFGQAGRHVVEVVVVDNNSSDGSVDTVREAYPQVHVIANTDNVGFARANNQGVRAARGRYVLLLNSDAMLTPGALDQLMALADARPAAGVIGAQLINRDGSFQASFNDIPTLLQEFLVLSGVGRLLFGRQFPSHGPEEEAGPKPAGWVGGACMLLPREVYLAAGGLDEDYFMYAEDVDLCCVIHDQGREVWYQPTARVIHLGGASSERRLAEREADMYRSRVHFMRKHKGRAAAVILKLMLLGITPVKCAVHGTLRLVSRGRLGRPVVGLRALYTTVIGA